ncbi:Dipeptidyl peptidase 2 [Phytophthora boehmeriae]|uniref:Dipeptidyl peptidase 2 n=1 Tax=Phytophthora boehmeriae TaxID=109152 RepID=A0A8T1X3C5_9STRA|nr:Dipeptidyl peptidase 2 [Phytophthora boehmeriae]
MSGSDSPYVEATVWSVFTIVVALASIAWTAAFDPGAAGSGIPEMKSIISYEHRKDASRCLRARTLISKIGGLTLALGSGVSVGKEGPFVHTSSIIAHRLMKHTRCFRRIYDSDMIRRHIYGAACAVGVTSTFRAPIGGTLFAIEVTSMIFMVSVGT